MRLKTTVAANTRRHSISGIWDFLSARAEELEEFFGSGSLFLDLDLFLMDAQTMLFTCPFETHLEEWSIHLSHIHGIIQSQMKRRSVSALSPS